MPPSTALTVQQGEAPQLLASGPPSGMWLISAQIFLNTCNSMHFVLQSDYLCRVFCLDRGFGKYSPHRYSKQSRNIILPTSVLAMEARKTTRIWGWTDRCGYKAKGGQKQLGWPLASDRGQCKSLSPDSWCLRPAAHRVKKKAKVGRKKGKGEKLSCLESGWVNTNTYPGAKPDSWGMENSAHSVYTSTSFPRKFLS